MARQHESVWPSYHCKSRLYVLQIPGSAFVKIGRARNPGLRAAELQVGSPYRYRLCGYIQEDEYINETTVHHALARYRVDLAGEWFVLAEEVREWMTAIGLAFQWSGSIAKGYSRDVRSRFDGEAQARLLQLRQAVENAPGGKAC